MTKEILFIPEKQNSSFSNSILCFHVSEKHRPECYRFISKHSHF